jgi:phosphonate transport system permease protein
MKVTPDALLHAVSLSGGFLAKFFVKPDLTYAGTLALLTLETFLIAFVASVFAAAVSFVAALLGARNCTPHSLLGNTVRAIAGVVRAVPDLLLALMLASTLGLGDVPGVMALFIATVAYLTKVFAEALEVVDKKAIEGIRATGASPFAVRLIGVVPQARADLIGLTFYGLDSNLRSAAILGAVGAGGIGYDLSNAVRHFRFDRLGMMILSIYLSVWAVDFLSNWVRSRVE